MYEILFKLQVRGRLGDDEETGENDDLCEPLHVECDTVPPHRTLSPPSWDVISSQCLRPASVPCDNSDVTEAVQPVTDQRIEVFSELSTR